MEADLGPLTKQEMELVKVVELLNLPKFMKGYCWKGIGCPPKRLDLQPTRSVEENLADLRQQCDVGCKRNSNRVIPTPESHRENGSRRTKGKTTVRVLPKTTLERQG